MKADQYLWLILVVGTILLVVITLVGRLIAGSRPDSPAAPIGA